MNSHEILHPLLAHATCKPPTGIELAATAHLDRCGNLHCHYSFGGDLDAILFPSPAPAQPVDGLWQHSCCEAFVGSDECPAYHEFNFAPSGCWAAYRFLGYREHDLGWHADTAIHIDFNPSNFTLDAVIPASLLPAGQILRIGLTTVIETHSGDKSYWALRHAAERPDFHLAASFTLILHRP